MTSWWACHNLDKSKTWRIQFFKLSPSERPLPHVAPEDLEVRADQLAAGVERLIWEPKKARGKKLNTWLDILEDEGPAEDGDHVGEPVEPHDDDTGVDAGGEAIDLEEELRRILLEDGIFDCEEDGSESNEGGSSNHDSDDSDSDEDGGGIPPAAGAAAAGMPGPDPTPGPPVGPPGLPHGPPLDRYDVAG
eukprot:8154790-Lingulodinium_polyedra.AAC.1